MIINTTSYVFFFFFKFILFFNLLLILLSTLLLIINNFFGNVAAIKEKNIAMLIKNILMVNIITNIFVISLLLYTILFFYKNTYINLLLSDIKFNLFYNHFNYYFYQFDLDIFNIIFYTLSLFVAFISLLALDTRIYSSKTIFLVLCNVLVLIIFMFSFTNNYVLFFVFYELLLIPSFFFVYRISPAKTSIQSSIYFVM